MEPITIITFLVGAVVTATPIVAIYAPKFIKAFKYLQLILTAINAIMKGNLDHQWTESEKIEAFDAIYPIAIQIDADTGISTAFK